MSITPEQFMTQTEADEPEDTEAYFEPLASIAASLERLARAAENGHTAGADATDPHKECNEVYAALHEAFDDLEDKHKALFGLLAQIEKIIKPSSSKLALSVAEAITRWRSPEVPVFTEVDRPAETPTDTDRFLAGESLNPSGAPLPDAPVEEWRAYAREFVQPGHTGPDVDAMNRSQIRTMLGIEHRP